MKKIICKLKINPREYSRLINNSEPIKEPQLKRKTILFAPHQDDEILACGGLIIKKIKAGAEVSVVFLCDGADSHARFMDQKKLSKIRKDEALNVLSSIGLPKENIFFLDYPDGLLQFYSKSAQKKIKNILEDYKPEEIIFPYWKDGQKDHNAAGTLIRKIIKEIRTTAKCYAYPVWYWNRWPWVDVSIHFNRNGLKKMIEIFKDRFHTSRVFNRRIYIKNIIEDKKEALSHYKSQTSNIFNKPVWPLLSDVAQGQWLSHFFTGYEFFKGVNL